MRTACIVLILLVAACGRDRLPGPLDSAIAVPPDSAVAEPQAPVRSGWDERAGPVLLVAGERPQDAIVVYPHLQGVEGPDTLDVTDYAGARATLIARRGVVGTVVLEPGRAEAEERGCLPWPRVAAPAGTAGWTVGFVGRAVDAIALDSVAALPPRDSARFVAEIARLASTLPGTRSGERAESFHGLPFVVKEGARFADGSREIAVAHVVRRVNQEANPLEEHTLLVLEREAEGSWAVAHSEHMVGAEDSVVRPEVLGGLRLGGRPTLVLALDGGEGVAYALLQRTVGGAWRRIWRSAQPGC